jgi:hypothetical protein
VLDRKLFRVEERVCDTEFQIRVGHGLGASGGAVDRLAPTVEARPRHKGEGVGFRGYRPSPAIEGTVWGGGGKWWEAARPESRGGGGVRGGRRRRERGCQRRPEVATEEVGCTSQEKRRW